MWRRNGSSCTVVAPIMNDPEKALASVRSRINPTLSKVSAAGLRAWLKTQGHSAPSGPKSVLTDSIAKMVIQKTLAEDTLEKALIGFEEASGKRIYLYALVDLPSGPPSKWLPARLAANSIPLSTSRSLSGHRTKPMTPIYGELNAGVLRVKWTEVQYSAKLGDNDRPLKTPEEKQIVLVADLKSGTAELRIDPPSNRHSYTDANGRVTQDAYYSAYQQRCRDVLGCVLKETELRSVIKSLVEEQTPRIVRIHVDNHTNQGNYKKRTTARADIRDDVEWQENYTKHGHEWAWDSQSFYWLPVPSSDRLRRELYSQIDATEGYVKVNADCSDEEVEYAISQVRAR